MINRQRLTDEFARQAAIDSPSFNEKAMADYLQERLTRLGAHVTFDHAGEVLGSSTGNLIARLEGTCDSDPFLIALHMDTVTPADNVTPVLHDGVFTSAGETILGADDKAGICELIEALEVMREQAIPHGPLEIVVTICEEQGLLGAKQLDFSQFTARQGIALDTVGVDILINRAPAANRLRIDIFGHEAHAGVCPEEGLSAIQIAGRALAVMPLGRIDGETTANIGTIHGGQASNIVPSRVSLRGEVRSHDSEKLRRQTEAIVHAVEQEVAQARIEVAGQLRQATMELELNEDFPALRVPEDSELIRRIKDAANRLERPQAIRAAGGGSDASIFSGQGIAMVILGTGMEQVHTVHERVAVADMVRVSELLVEILRATPRM